jgi:hypothetical protein
MTNNDIKMSNPKNIHYFNLNNSKKSNFALNNQIPDIIP